VTTILADFKLGVMVSDTVASDGDRVWPGEKKVYRIRGALFGFAGSVSEAHRLIAWIKEGAQGHPPKVRDVNLLMLSKDGLFLYDENLSPMLNHTGVEAIGTGAKAALCAYEALGFQNPKKAVQIVCKYDNASRLPVKVYKL
jgi:ATP-dependent protease HslVU (ClpYQ) peptidase subunit